jgi:hypothetical protein
MLALTGAAAVLALAGCGSGGDAKAAAVPSAATGSLEHLAAEVKCTPNIQIDADELRQAVCKKSKDADGKFILATFATDRGQREWINGAKDYGGHFLVGRKWVAVGDTAKTVTALRRTLGGDIEEGTDHSTMGATHSAH